MREVDPLEVRALLEEGATLLDVREAHEWRAGRAPGAQHLPLAEVTAAALTGAAPVLAICRSGRRSAAAVTTLTVAGRDARNVRGGMLAWRDAGLPVITEDGAAGEVV